MKSVTFAAPRIKKYETDDFRPSHEPRFVAVSLNGEACHLQCDHCRTRMLKALYKVESPEGFRVLASRLAARGCRGMLLTGGCGADGTIPLPPYVDVAREARNEFRLRYAVHTKMVTEEFARAAAAVGTELLMTDLVGDDESLRTVYHLRSCGIEDVRKSLDLAEAHGLRLAPHIMIGIAWGKVVGERVALDMLRGRNVAALSLVVLTPLRLTPMAGVKIDLPAVLEFLSEARQAFPDIRMTLGCAKTGGKTQRVLEEHALKLGFDAIAYPSEGIVDLARAMGYEVRLSEACCSFGDAL